MNFNRIMLNANVTMCLINLVLGLMFEQPASLVVAILNGFAAYTIDKTMNKEK